MAHTLKDIPDPRLQIDTTELRTLASRFYTDENILELEKQQLFYKSWQYACHKSELEKPGSYVTVEILGQNIFVVRNKSDELKAFYNVCPHRGHKLLEKTGTKRTIVCPYHQWSYSLDGNLLNNRKTQGQSKRSQTPGGERICLTAVRVDFLLDFIFVNLDPDAEPIAQYWPGLEQHVRQTVPNLQNYTLSDNVSALHPVDLKANWKIHVDNFLECYHCRVGHDSFSDMLEIANQTQSLHKNYSYVFIPSSGKAENKAYPLHPDYDDMDLHFWHLFPNIGLAQFAGPGNLSISRWLPLGPHRAQREIAQLDIAEPTDPEMIKRRELRTIWARDVLQPEDIEFIESVHVGMTQRCFDQGWYMIDPDNEEISEIMLRHFHQTYLSTLYRDALPDD